MVSTEYRDVGRHTDRYPGELPGGVTFADGPAEVARKLGKPEKEEDIEKAREVDGKPQDEL